MVDPFVEIGKSRFFFSYLLFFLYFLRLLRSFSVILDQKHKLPFFHSSILSFFIFFCFLTFLLFISLDINMASLLMLISMSILTQREIEKINFEYVFAEYEKYISGLGATDERYQKF